MLHRSTTLTLGVVGCGGIGRQVATFAGSLFARTLGFDPAIDSASWPRHIERVEDIETLFAQSNVVTVHVPLTPQTDGLVNVDLLRRLPPGSYLVNAARGTVISLADLIAALDEGVLADAGLDVLPVEPPDAGDPLLAIRTFEDMVPRDYAAAYFGLLDALTTLFNKPVDLLAMSAVTNPYFLRGIEPTRRLLYAA